MARTGAPPSGGGSVAVGVVPAAGRGLRRKPARRRTAAVDVPEGRYRNVLSGEEQDLAGPTPAASLAQPQGFSLYKRV